MCNESPDAEVRGVYHDFAWRGWWDFGTGALGDMACHTFNMPFMALDLKNPTSIEAEHAGHNKDSYPAWAVIKFMFPAVGSRPAIPVTWYDGGKQPDVTVSPHYPKDKDLPKSGSMIIGEDGTLVLPHIGDPHLYPDEKFKGYAKPELEPKDHYHEFVDCCLNGGKPGANFDFAGPLAEAVRGWRGDRRACHAHVLERFSAQAMARGYLQCYEQVLAGELPPGVIANGLRPSLPFLVLLVFLPPLIYDASLDTSAKELRAHWRPILLLAVGLVLATMAVVAVAFHHLVPGATWGVAFALGAIVSPPDSVAATQIAGVSQVLHADGSSLAHGLAENLVAQVAGLAGHLCHQIGRAHV